VLAIITTLFGGITNWRFDAQKMAAAQLEGYKIALNAIADNPVANDPRIHHIKFRDLSTDPVAALRGFYAKNDLEFSDVYETRLRAWLDDPLNKSDRYGRYTYSLTPYGLDPNYVKQAFAPYRRRFGLA
jgi:hypothetical protein